MIKSKETLADDEYQRAVFSTDLSNCTPYSGQLSRKSSKGFWQKRWFYLNNQFLIYKKDEHATESKGVLSLNEISSINTNANVLEMTMSDGSYKLQLRGESNEQMKCWEGRIYERITWYNSQLQEVTTPTATSTSVGEHTPPAEELEASKTTTPSTDDTLSPLATSTLSSLLPAAASTTTAAPAAAKEYRQLVVELVQAKSLIGCTKNGLSCPIVSLKLLGHTGKEIPNECATSHLRPDTVNPTWEQVFVFGSKEYGISVSALSMPSLLLEVHHKPEGLVIVEKPMGQVLIPLSTVSVEGSALEDWFKLEKAGRMVAVSGELRLKLKWIKLPADKAKDKAIQLAAVEEQKKKDKRRREPDLKDGDTKSEHKNTSDNNLSMARYQTDQLFEDMDPNELVVTVFRCQNLRWTNKKKALPDPVVSVKLNQAKAKKQWNIRQKTINPVYNDTYFFSVKDPSMSLTVSIEYNDLIKNTFVGQSVISLRPLQNKLMVKQWYKLRNMYGQVSAVDLGNVELGLVWRFNPELADAEAAIDSKPRGLSFLKGFGIGSDSDTDLSDEDQDDETTTTYEAASAEVMELAAVERAKVDSTLFAELGKVRLKTGSYQVQVHILEVRELAAKNLNGLSDPVIFIEVNGEKQRTITVKNCLCAVYDELFLFKLKHMEKEELERIEIHIKVFDANVLTKSVMIGSYSVDLESVYLSKDHEKYRQWVGLTNHEDPSATSFQGYLKYSVQVVGEDEIVKVHNEEEENRKEEALQVKNGCPLVGVLAPPNIVKQWVFLVVAVYEADYLPVMDRSILAFKKDGTDAYAELQFSSNHPVRTRVKTLKGSTRENMSPTFNYELWVPVSIPSSSQHISFSMWDYEMGVSNELIGTHYTSLKRLLQLPADPVSGHDKSTGLYWANIYGAHKSTRDEVLEQVKKGVSTAHSAINQNLTDRDYKEYYNRSPTIAPSYNGRVLISQRITEHYHRPKKYLSDNYEPFMRSIRKLSPSLQPAVQKYKLKAILVRGSDLPSVRELSGKEAQKLQVMVSIGKHEIMSRAVNCVGKNCLWGELMESEDLQLPQDLTQVPDIFVYLMTASASSSAGGGGHQDPVCFKRFAVRDIMDQNFQASCEWIMLNKDYKVNGIHDSERPGHLLLKLGFGPVEVEEKHRAEWESTLLRQKRRTPFQIRVHLYQGKDFPATDDNGLSDPYLKFNLLGEVKQSTIKRKTRFPLYYETITFDCLLPDREFLPLLDCQVYDKDLIFDDFVGRFSIPLSEAFEVDYSTNTNADLPDPHYIPMFVEKPGDGQGEVLVSVQLLQKEPGVTLAPPPSLLPHTRAAFIEITALGLRNMHPFKFQKMVSPFVEVFVQSIGGKHLVGTETSKTPSPANPNFLEQFTVEVKLPRNALYSVPLMITAKDVRMGGLLRPEVGIAYVDITNKIPWSKDYIPPQSNVFFKDEFRMKDDSAAAHEVTEFDGFDGVGKEAFSILQKNQEEVAADDYIVTQTHPVDIKTLIRRRMEEEDSGVGVFGALAHLALPDYKGHRKRTADDYFADIDWDEDSDDDSPPKYMEGRTVLDQELEKKLKNSPFESYKLCRGNKFGLFPTFKDNVGLFKGLVRVFVDADNPPPFDMAQLRIPQTYVCRLYVLRGLNLTPMDPGFGGRPGKSDPYLKIKLGDVIFNDRENAVDDVTDVDFYKMIEFGCELPGISQLVLQVYDHDFIGADDLIGETTIDLEDRWFDQKWQQIGEENKLEPSRAAGQADEEPPRWNTKDVERRTLYVPTSNASQGLVECWLDMMSPDEASGFPPDDIALPPRQVFEVRLVVWKCKDVPAADTFGGQDMTDMYIKSWIEGCDVQETDTHWRAKKGNGSFNWRMQFDVELGHNSRAMKFPYLHLQLWDRDLLKWNDCMAESTVNLGVYFRKAFKKQIAIKLFETERGSARAKSKKKKAKRRNQAQNKINLDDFNIPDTPVPEEDEDKLDEASGDKGKEEKEDNSSSSFFSFFRRKPKQYSEAASSEEKASNKDSESSPLLSSAPKEDSKEQEQLEEEEEMEFVRMIKNMTGLWDMDPDDSTWLFMDRLDHESGIREPMGKMCYGLQIWPKKVAKVMPVGNGRQEPNQDPFLPPPSGRLKFSWNPFVLGSSLCGPKLCFRLSCCFFCIAFVVLLIFCQPVFNILIAVFVN